ncbi:alkaline phosphatase [Parabacteroides sp. OttesenSCG-928-G06]|nr:alkaline phosphatase [Parabacteroides sp. OttesenSCG-928-G06]
MMVSCGLSTGQQGKTRDLPKHVILVGFDGLSASSINKGADMPMLRQLMAEGSSTLECRSILPSSSACNWASMFMGAGPELHGYTTWGSQKPELPSRVVNKDNRFPNIFGLYRDRNPEAEIGYFFEWGGMHYLVDTLAIDMHVFTPDCTQPAVQYIKDKKPNFCAIIYAEPDGVGHGIGWDTPEYMEKIHHLDKCLAEIVNAVEEAGIMDETVIIVSSDHGGIGTGHGGKTMQEMQRPLVYYGKNIKKGFKIPESTMIYDIAGTMAYLLDVEQPQVWIARPTLSVFEK